jgi:uncharacterized protein with PIN domain
MMQALASLVFEGELIGLLRKPWPGGVVRYPVDRRASLKDVIEALGPPHTEVHGLAANGREVDFSTLLEPGMAVTVGPARFPIDVTQATVLRPQPLPRLAFAADANVGKLATLLRLLGWDTTFARDIDDASLAELACAQGRVVLSRDRNCLKRSKIVHGRLVRANDPLEQIRDIVVAYGIKEQSRPFSRCLRCNEPLVAVDKARVWDRLEPRTKRYYDSFWRCPACQRIYWAGSHHDGMLRLLETL